MSTINSGDSADRRTEGSLHGVVSWLAWINHKLDMLAYRIWWWRWRKKFVQNPRMLIPFMDTMSRWAEKDLKILHMKHSNFGAEFKALRKSKGLALQTVAKKTKVACSGLSRWENNPRHNISLPTVQKCFALLDMAVVICPVIKTK